MNTRTTAFAALFALATAGRAAQPAQQREVPETVIPIVLSDGAEVLDRSTVLPFIVNGLATTAYPTTALILFANGGSCTGTLIGCSTVLTAAHCFDTPVNPSEVLIFLQHGGLALASSVAVHPSFEFGVRSDLAIVRLTQPVSGIEPTPINTTSRLPYGTIGVIAGFGREGGSLQAGGIKRVGTVTTSQCSSAPDATHVCWDFLAPIGAPGLDSNTCQGDSGGPLFAAIGGTVKVTGVTSGGDNVSCLSTDHAYDADVFFDRSWIQSTAGSDLGGTSCGSLPNAGSAGAPSSGALGSLTSQAPQVRYQVNVPSGTQLLRITVNSENPLENDFDLYLKRNGPPTETDFDCKSELEMGLEVCQVQNPQAGTFHILVQRFEGSGQFQVTTVAFAQEGTGSGPCVQNATTLCLLDNRFEVKATYTDYGNNTGSGQAVELTPDSGYFWFFDAANVEAVGKVVSFCSINGSFGFYAGGLTDVGVVMTVRDTVANQTQTFTNTRGNNFNMISSAFNTCGQ